MQDVETDTNVQYKNKQEAVKKRRKDRHNCRMERFQNNSTFLSIWIFSPASSGEAASQRCPRVSTFLLTHMRLSICALPFAIIERALPAASVKAVLLDFVHLAV